MTIDESLERWERLRSRGRTAFIWRYGVAMWGIPAAVITILYKIQQELGLSLASLALPFPHKLRLAIGISMVFFPILGHVFGRQLWDRGEADYQRRGGK